MVRRPRGYCQPSIINMVVHINSEKIVSGTSPTIKRSRLTQVSSATSQPVHTTPAGSKGTGSAAQETQFTSGLTNKTYHTQSWDDLNCVL